MLKGKTCFELETLQHQVEETIASVTKGVQGIDVEFWEEVGQQIQVFQARLRLKELHENILNQLQDVIHQHSSHHECLRKLVQLK